MKRCVLNILIGLTCLLLSPLMADEPKTAQEKREPRLKSPIRAWFQPQYLDTKPELYANITIVTSLDDAALAEKVTKRGVLALKWCYGPNSEWSDGKSEYYSQQCAPFIKGSDFRFAGVGIDEWNPSDKRFAKEKDLAASGYRAARKKWPDSIMVGWVTKPDSTFTELLRDGTLDLAIIEGYSFIPDVGGLTIEGICERCDVMKKAGLLDRTIVCFGYVSAAKDKHGRRMTFEELEKQVRHVKKKYPEMPGVAFYGFKDDSPETLELIQRSDALSGELYASDKSPRK
jgi:hypothetical protein